MPWSALQTRRVRDLAVFFAGPILSDVKWNWERMLPWVFIVVAALTRWPGLFPPSFSAFYALAFCAGAFFPGRVAWWVPMGTLLVTDIALNCYYYFALGIQAFQWFQLMTYVGFALLVVLGRSFGSHRRWLTLLAGGIFGACLFYLLTNTAAWFLNPFGNPEYTKDFAGWLRALTRGTAGHPPTWEFFRNTLLSGGLFTGLFAGVHHWVTSRQSEPAVEPEAEPAEAEPEAEPESAKA
jgi:hypothetical protein